MGRRPLPEGQARTEKLYTKVKPSAAQAFREKCASLNLTTADALRLALTEWMKK